MSKNTSAFRATQTLIFPNGTRLRAPFAGTATQWDNDSGGFRAARLPAQEDTAPALQAALQEAGFVEQETIHLDVNAASMPASASKGLRSPQASEKVVLEPKKAPVAGVQVVLYKDEAGGMSWHLPDASARVASKGGASDYDILRAPGRTTFTIPTRTTAARRSAESGQTEMRGIITAIGRKVLKVLVIPIAAKVLANPVELIVAAVERKHSQNLIRAVDAQNYQQRITVPFADWPALAGKRSLLIVHGIISSTDGMLSKLPAPAMEDLAQRYEGRVIAYDHFTLSMDPDANAALFLNQAKKGLAGKSADFDILCHSRGGIVSRALVERGQKLVPGHRCVFKNVFFVATPNAGSALGNAEHIVDMVDVFTNFLTKFPDGTAAYVIEAVLGILKIAVYTAGTAIPGLAAMGTEGYIKTVLNSCKDKVEGVEYGAAAADYDPDPNSPHAFFAAALNAAADRTFAVGGKAVGNDLVVPRDGVYMKNGNPMFPIADPLLYKKADYVYHNDFFEQARTIERVNQFLATGDEKVEAIKILEGPPARYRKPAPAPPRSRPRNGGSGWGGGAGDGDALRGTFSRIDGFPGGGLGRIDFAGPRSEEKKAAKRKSAKGAKEGRELSIPTRLPQPEKPKKSMDEGYDDIFRGLVKAGGAPAPPSAPKKVAQKPVLAAVELERQPQIEFHERVTEEETNALVVKLQELTATAAELETRIGVALAAGKQSVEVTVFLSATGFKVKPSKATMTVKRERNEESERVTFQLTADKTDVAIKRAIHADFFLDNSIIGSVTHYTYVVPKGYTGLESAGETENDGFGIPRRPRQDCDWVVAAVGASPSYQLLLNSEIPNRRVQFKDMGTLKIQVPDLTKYIDSILTKKFAEYPQPDGMSEAKFQAKAAAWRSDFTDTIESLGKDLWQWLPKTFRDEYFDLHRAGILPRSISIHSDEMVFPWELVIPNETRDGKLNVLKRLGVAHVLGRWKPGLATKPAEQTLKVRKFRVLNPDYAAPNTLKWAAEEAKELAKRFPGVVTAVNPADLDGVKKLFNESDVQLLHFSGHGEIDGNNPNLNKILLEKGQEFEALKLVATKLCAEGQPVVYMNACSVGNVGETVGRAGGFAANFVTNGCSGVIAPLWPINDRRSMEFALALYGKLILGRAIGEALQELRDENEKDPTYHAYTYFGDPWVRLVFSRRKAA